jgi:demethylmenaquinone methyltransferase/2-methoxy-6-polyprenyl-1,4-benzoquinol methylase
MTEKEKYDPAYIKSLFNKMSGSYERVNYITSFGFSLRWRKLFLRSLGRCSDKLKIIDLMTGMGETWKPVKKYFPNAEFSALDFSEGMLKFAEEKNEKQFGNSIQLHCMNVLENDLPAEHYDIVMSAFGLKTFNENQISLLAKQIKRILKKGGRFSFIEVSSPANKILGALYKLHLGKVVPVCGKILLGNPTEYKMLWRFTEAYQNSQRAARLFENEGLKVVYDNYFGGCASGFHGEK